MKTSRCWVVMYASHIWGQRDIELKIQLLEVLARYRQSVFHRFRGGGLLWPKPTAGLSCEREATLPNKFDGGGDLALIIIR